jgi:hypothetical protein
MTKLIARMTVLAILLLSLAALPAHAQTIQAGNDFWVTPANNQTIFLFPDGEVESLCGAPASSSWDHHVFFRGIPQAGSDWDTVVARLSNATFNSSGTASTKIQVKSLNFASIAPQPTPCGKLSWKATLFGPQPITVMTLRRTSERGGFFSATISVRVQLTATDAATGALVGSLFYTRDLPDMAGGTAWSFGPTGAFRAGMTETDNCIDVLRKKLLVTDPDSSHWYFISDMIAQGRCTKQ